MGVPWRLGSSPRWAEGGALAIRADIVGRRGDCRCALFLLGVGILGTLGQEAVARLREDPGLRERLGRSGRQAYEETYS